MAYWDGTAWVPDTPVTAPLHRGYGTRLLGAAAEGLLIVLLVSGLVAGTALAAKGGGGKGPSGGDRGTLVLVMVDDANGDGVPSYGDTVTFDVATTATDKPYVNVRCYRDAVLVYDGWAGFFTGAWFGTTFALTSTTWIGGDADCTARLVMWANNGRERTLAEQGFYVGP